MLNTDLLKWRNKVYTRYAWVDRISPERHLVRGQAYLIAKRILDLVLVVVLSPIVLPVLALTALIIKIQDPSAPIFFIQQRTGKGGQRFSMYKFRTMVPNAEELKKDLADLNEDGELAGPLKIKNDPRVTRIGRILRKTSLDEVPQIINIIKGEMSWVGPRPTSFGLQSYDLWHTERLDVTPGITGLWQLYGRGDTEFDCWLYWDEVYIEKKSLWVDFQIMLRTGLAVVEQRGAH